MSSLSFFLSRFLIHIKFPSSGRKWKKFRILQTTGNFQKEKFGLVFIISEHLIFFLKKKKRERERKIKGTVDNRKEAFCNVWQLDSPGVAGHGISLINTNAFKDFYI